MKVTFKYGIKTYSGTVDEMTYGSFRDDNLCIGRKYVMPTLTANNTLRGTIIKNLAAIYGSLSSSYKDDLKVYAAKNAVNVPKDKLPPTSFAIWMRMMYLFSELDSGHVDLATVTYTDLQTVGADIASIAEAVVNGYLPEVSGADSLTATM